MDPDENEIWFEVSLMTKKQKNGIGKKFSNRIKVLQHAS